METKIRVLVADANHDFCTLIKNLISAESDMEVVGATDDGLETLALVAELTPDVLIMDLALTKLDGLEVLRRIPESGAHPHVIVLSGFLNNNVVSACSSLGADYFMPKPCATRRHFSAECGSFPATVQSRPTPVTTASSFLSRPSRM